MAIFVDTFTDTAGTDLTAHTPETGTWALLWQSAASEPDATINASNQLVFDADVNDGVVYQCNGTYPSADYDLEITVVSLVNITTAPSFLFVRIQDIDNLYALRLGQPGVSDSRLYKKVAGAWTALGSAFATPANGSVVKLEVIGTALKAYDDGVEVASATDSDISAAGKAGIGAGGGAELIVSGDDSRAHVFDNLTVTDLGAGASPQTITVSGIGSAEAFGTAQLNLTLAPSAIASAEAFGTAAVQPGPVTVSPSAIDSAEAFGTHRLDLTVSPSGVASAEALGDPTVVPGTVTVTASGIATAEALGTAQLDLTLSGIGIASAEAFGTTTITPGPVTITGTAIGSAEAFGTATVSAGVTFLSPSAIASAETFGTAALQPGAVTITAQGVATGEAFGDATAQPGAVTVTPTGIAGAEAFGAARMDFILAASGIGTADAFGMAALAFELLLQGIAGEEAFGTAAITGGASAEPGAVTVGDAAAHGLAVSEQASSVTLSNARSGSVTVTVFPG